MSLIGKKGFAHIIKDLRVLRSFSSVHETPQPGIWRKGLRRKSTWTLNPMIDVLIRIDENAESYTTKRVTWRWRVFNSLMWYVFKLQMPRISGITEIKEMHGMVSPVETIEGRINPTNSLSSCFYILKLAENELKILSLPFWGNLFSQPWKMNTICKSPIFLTTSL